MQTKPLPTASRLIADHMKWYGRLAEVSVLIAEHVAKQEEVDPAIADLVKKWHEINGEKAS